jgi:UDP-glucose 4-epimerase
VATHRREQFIEVNVAGTLVLLEEAAAAGVEAFVFTSTTSAFGAASRTRAGEPAAWITEDVAPVPRNIYGVSKLAAEGLSELFARREGLPTVVLRTARFFPEADDDPQVRQAFTPENAQANELLYRRADIEDVVEAHLLAAARAPQLGFGRYIVSATTPFRPEDAAELGLDPAKVVARRFPAFESLYAARGWQMFDRLDRVYDNAAARAGLGWRPRHDFDHVLACLAEGRDVRSPLARAVGAKGYHAEAFDEGPYPVA